MMLGSGGLMELRRLESVKGFAHACLDVSGSSHRSIPQKNPSIVDYWRVYIRKKCPIIKIGYQK